VMMSFAVGGEVEVCQEWDVIRDVLEKVN